MNLQRRRFDGTGLALRQRGAWARASGMARQWLCGALVILCVALFAWHPAEAEGRGHVQSCAVASKATGGATGADFAIADFDGDSLPDFATVQPGPAMASQTNYWIRFELSLGNQQSFAISGPTGGLQIASRDVNGDSFLDLIISTRISNEPVAVLLNDGRGNFRLADTADFGAAIWEAQQEWRAGATGCGDTESALASAGWAGGICDSGVCAEPAPAIARVFLAGEKLRYFILPRDVRGRAPPAA